METNAAAMKVLRQINERLQTIPLEERTSFRLEEGMLGPVHFKVGLGPVHFKVGLAFCRVCVLVQW